MANLKLHCPDCWKLVVLTTDRRVHRCTHCRELNYFKPALNSDFLQSLKNRTSYNSDIKRLAGDEEILQHELHTQWKEEKRISSSYLETRKKGRSTRRVLALTLIILALSAFILFVDVQSIQRSFIPVFILGTLLGLSILVIIIQNTGVSIEKNRLQEGIVIRKQKEKQMRLLQKKMDKIIDEKFSQ